jgi:hypothetical protein
VHFLTGIPQHHCEEQNKLLSTLLVALNNQATAVGEVVEAFQAVVPFFVAVAAVDGVGSVVDR